MGRVVGLALIALLLVFASGLAPAAAQPSGPAAVAAAQWFGSDRSLGCFDQSARESVCGPWIEHELRVYYGDAGGSGGNRDALAVVSYVNDPTGNARSTAAAYLHQDGGAFRFVRAFTHLRGQGVAPGTTVRFGDGKVTLTMVTLRPNEPLCCPTGRTPLTLALR